MPPDSHIDWFVAVVVMQVRREPRRNGAREWRRSVTNRCMQARARRWWALQCGSGCIVYRDICCHHDDLQQLLLLPSRRTSFLSMQRMEDSESNNAISSGGFRKHVYKQHVSPAALTQRCSEQQEASKQLRGTLSGSWYRSVVVRRVVEGRGWTRYMSGEGCFC